MKNYIKVTSVTEAFRWLSFLYKHCRNSKKNAVEPPVVYQTNSLFTVEHSAVEQTVFTNFYKLAIAVFRPVIS